MLFREADVLHAPLVVAQTRARRGEAPLCASLLALDNPAIQLSALKEAARGEGLIVRLYNPTGQSQPVNLSFDGPLQSVALVDLNETPVEALPFVGGDVALKLLPKKIITLLVTL